MDGTAIYSVWRTQLDEKCPGQSSATTTLSFVAERPLFAFATNTDVCSDVDKAKVAQEQKRPFSRGPYHAVIAASGLLHSLSPPSARWTPRPGLLFSLTSVHIPLKERKR